MVLEFALTEADYVGFLDYHFANSSTVQRTRRQIQYGFGAFFLVIGAVMAYLTPGFITGWFGLALGATFLALTPWWLRRSYRQQATKMLKEGKNQSLLGRHTIELDANGLGWRSTSGEGKVNWSAIEKVESSEQFLLVYLNAVTAVIIPRAGVLSGDFDQFVRVVKERVR